MTFIQKFLCLLVSAFRFPCSDQNLMGMVPYAAVVALVISVLVTAAAMGFIRYWNGRRTH